MASVKVLKDPVGHSLYRPWAEQVRPRLAASGLDWRLLAELLPQPPRTIPVFIAPPPSTPEPDLGLELAVLRSTPAERVRAGLDGLGSPSPRRIEALRASPETGLVELCGIIESYWELALAPYWPRMLTLMKGDALHRARLLAEGGAHRLLNDLDPAITWTGETLQVPHRHTSGTKGLGGRGLLLVPSVFAWPRVYSITSPSWQPTLRYPPRGIATLWERTETQTPEALAAVVGRSRALLLTELHAPASTTDLARRTGLTAGGVSQQLTALRAAGLVSAHRTGRFVLYARTSAAEALLQAAVN
ncbi:winged helix-turn-helix domain-containing protein [Kitasatospora sp. MAP5-34]|uniref:ArsR/SmtB family transcription factor n=1 Tax=Kitasatospora sp. MAP5-34 TaxID=3035102 RepID=UPI0032AF6CE3